MSSNGDNGPSLGTQALNAVGGPTGAIGMGAGVASSILAGLNDKPSKEQLALNGQVGQFSAFMDSQARQEGLDASTVFHNLMGPLQRIVQGGPNQAGWNMEETNAYNTQVKNASAAAVRNLAASGAGVSAGGGNTPAMGGSWRTGVLNAQANIENNESNQEAQGIMESNKLGNENFFKAAGEEKELPSVFATANQGASVSNETNTTALKSQAAVDAEKKASSGLGIASSALGAVAGQADKAMQAQGGKNTGPGAGNISLPGYAMDKSLIASKGPVPEGSVDNTQNDLIPAVSQ